MKIECDDAIDSACFNQIRHEFSSDWSPALVLEMDGIVWDGMGWGGTNGWIERYSGKEKC